MNINPNISNMMNPTGGVTYTDFVKNAQNHGMQQSNGIKSQSEEEQNRELSDSVSISFSSPTEETSETGKSKENEKSNSASNTGNTKGTEQTQNAGQAKNSSGTEETKTSSTPVNLGSSSLPTADELDFDAGMPGSNVSTCTDLVPVTNGPGTAIVPVDGGSGNGGSGTTDLVPVTDGPGTDLVPVSDSTTAVVPVADDVEVVEGEIVEDNPETTETNTSGTTEETSNASTSETQQNQEFDPIEFMNALKEQQAKWEEIDKIWMEMITAREKHMAEMWKLMMDTQNSINEIMQQTIQAQAASEQAIFRGWCDVIAGPHR